MVLFLGLVPVYIFIATLVREGAVVHVPAIALDGLIPLRPEWSIVYGSLYWTLIVLPVFVVREEEHIRRRFSAYLAVWLTAYACFWLYPTVAPRGHEVTGDGFAVWGLRALYGADPPYNCLPSLHVAHSFVSAFAISRVHRRAGLAAIGAAVLVGLSTLFVKQHYVLDVVTGALLAAAAWAIFLRNSPRERIPELDRKLVVPLAVCAVASAGLAVAGFWVVYMLTA
jgi:membrane-associated phospholipid phosphatase